MNITAEPSFLTDHKQIKAWLDSVGVKSWNINEAGLVDVDGSVFLGEKLGSLTKLAVRFGKVTGDFFCEYNQLVSLEGAPKEVGKNFLCDHNLLVSLEGAPEETGGNFYCNSNQLVSLKGATKKVGWDFYCDDNQLLSLEGSPKEVCGNFVCYRNLLVDFKGLEGVSIGKDLYVIDLEEPGQDDDLEEPGPDNVFVSLEGLPKELYGRVQGLDIKALLALEAQHSSILDIEI